MSIPGAGSDAALQNAMQFRHSLLASHPDAPLQQLSRLTLCTGDPTTAATALACNTAQAYNILAVQPATERVLLQVTLPASLCVSLEVDAAEGCMQAPTPVIASESVLLEARHAGLQLSCADISLSLSLHTHTP